MLLTRLTHCGITQGSALISTRFSTNLADSGPKFFAKQEKLGRPMSPHLTIYSPQLTSMLSISHRITGVGYGVVFYGGALLTGTSHGLSHYIDLLSTIAPSTGPLIALKTIFLFPLMFHTFNGFRHLIWDTGKNFEIENVYKTGYVVIAISLLATLAIVAATSF